MNLEVHNEEGDSVTVNILYIYCILYDKAILTKGSYEERNIRT
jgi:hypothetical protein